jgi:hypothetical protein
LNAATLSPTSIDAQPDRVQGPRLAGIWQKAGIGVWAIVWCFCLLVFAMAIFTWFRWDSTPAAVSALTNPTMTPADVQSYSDYQDVVIQAGLSLAAYGGLFAGLRLLSGIPYFILSALVMRRRSDRLMAVLFAIVLAVIGAAGRWIMANWIPLPHDYPWLSQSCSWDSCSLAASFSCTLFQMGAFIPAGPGGWQLQWFCLVFRPTFSRIHR